MTDQPPILRSRTVPAHLPVPASEADAQLDVELRRANAVAKAGDAVPKSYRGNPGAVLLAAEWAHNRGIDLLTAIQTVAFIGGRPVIDATMQRALAKRAGYRVTIVEASPATATVAVHDLDQSAQGVSDALGEATYTIEDAQRAGLTVKDNWKNNPEDMLVARATTRAMRRFAPDVMVGLVVGEDELDQLAPDPVVTLHTTEGEDGTVPAVSSSQTRSEPATDAVVDAEVVGEGARGLVGPSTDVPSPTPDGWDTERDQLQADLRDAYGDVDTETAAQFKAWRSDKGYPARFDHMTSEALRDCWAWFGTALGGEA